MNFWGCPLEEVEEHQVRDYWLHCKDELGWSGATLRISYSGITREQVTFKYQKVDSSKWQKMTVPVFEFMRRFLQHVLPKGFVKVRHFGFLSPNFALPIQRIRELICVLYECIKAWPVKVRPPKKPKPFSCPHCHALMRWVRFIPAYAAGP